MAGIAWKERLPHQASKLAGSGVWTTELDSFDPRLLESDNVRKFGEQGGLAEMGPLMIATVVSVFNKIWTRSSRPENGPTSLRQKSRRSSAVDARSAAADSDAVIPGADSAAGADPVDEQRRRAAAGRQRAVNKFVVVH